MKKLVTLICAIVTVALLCNTANAQSDSIGLWKTMPRLKTLPQEKLYLHFDKPYYVAGERMWFRAYLANANTHEADTSSCAVYVELINSVDSLVTRIKIPHKHGVFSGSINLDEKTPEGVYTVRAYTNWMRNAGSDFFFNRQFFIGNSLSSQVRSTIKYSFPDDKKAVAEIKFDQKNTPFANKKISYYLNLSDRNKAPRTAITNADGVIKIEYNPRQIKGRKPLIHLNYEEGLSKYERNYILPSNKDFDIQFFPEGGNLVRGVSNCVAFKAIQSNGMSIDVSGSVYDKANNKICDFKSSNLGMGKFFFLPDTAKQYYAQVTTAKGETKRIELPAVQLNKISLSVNYHNGKMSIGFKADYNPDTLYLIGHSRGSTFCNLEIMDINKPISFLRKNIRSGVTSFLLADKKGNPLSERLVFIKPEKFPELSLEWEKQDLQSREKANAQIKVTDEKGNPIEGSFSVSVTDANDVQYDPNATNIVNCLLLSSDLTGYIEQPNKYFDPNFKDADNALDVLMLTQGWKRFDLQKILKKEKEEAPYFLEQGQAISGTVKSGFFYKLKPGTVVSILAPKIKYFATTLTDENGRFSFSGFQFPDSTGFTVSAKQKKGIKDLVDITVDEDSFPSLTEDAIRPENVLKVSDNQLESSNKKYINENGMITINLKEFEVVESKKSSEAPVAETGFLYSYEDYSLQGANLARFLNQPIKMAIQSLPGMSSWSEYKPVDTNVYTDDNASLDDYGPSFAVDGDLYTYNEIQNIDIADLDAIKLFKSYNKSRNSINDFLIVFVFKPNKGVYNSRISNPDIIRINPLGYAKNVQFYQPKYEVESVKNNKSNVDWRSTLAWQPELKTDAAGNGSFWFYTADRESKYNVVIEGLSNKGEPCYFENSYFLFKK